MRSHGGGVIKLLQQSGKARSELVDFSASINPLGLPSGVRQALVDSLPLLGDYPEIDAASLRRALAAFHRVDEGMVLPAGGSTALIYLLPRVLRPRRALLVAPCFSEYRPALEQAGCKVDELVLDAAEDFRFDPRQLLDALAPQTDMVWLANPANPTGAVIAPEILAELARALAPVTLVVDEAFVDFCPQYSLVDVLPQLPNLVLLRSLTKFYAIPGLRAGYLLAAAERVARLVRDAEPWNLSTPAILAARACLDDADYRRRSFEQIPQLRAQLHDGLEQLGAHPFPAVANYLLCRLPVAWPDATELAESLARSQLLVRTCSDFSGLDGHFLRLAVRSATENSRLLEVLSHF